MKYTIGVDLGGTNILAGLVDQSGKLVGTDSVETHCERGAEAVAKSTADLCEHILKQYGLTFDDCISLGIGVPGTVNKKEGMIEYANNLYFENVPFVALLKQYIKIPVYMDNDGNVAAWGEFIAGSGKEYHSLVAVTLGTGVGSGIVINDKIFEGCNGGSGELGHMGIDLHGVDCNCGRKGCYEEYASATALVAQTKAAMKESKDSILWKLTNGDLNQVNGQLFFQAVRENDKTAVSVLEQYIKYLAYGIINVVNFLQPEIITVSGGICKAGDLFLPQVIKLVEENRYTRNSKVQTIIKIADLGSDAGVIGAALLND